MSAVRACHRPPFADLFDSTDSSNVTAGTHHDRRNSCRIGDPRQCCPSRRFPGQSTYEPALRDYDERLRAIIGAAHIGAWVAIGLGVGVVVGVVIDDTELAMAAGAIAGAGIGVVQGRRARSEDPEEESE